MVMDTESLVSFLQKTDGPTESGGSTTIPTVPQSARDGGMRLFYVQLGFLILVILIIALRAYCKVFVVKKTTLDDWLMFLAAAMYTPYGVMAMHGVTAGGTGKPVGTYTAEMAAVSLRAWYICEVLYSPITICIRVSICVFLLRIAAQKLHRWILIGNIGIISIISVAYFFVMVLQCSPPSFFWEQVLGAEGRCIDPNIVPDATIAHSVISAISDWIVGFLPIAILWGVKINRRTKVTIAFMLSLGIIAGVVILIRIPYLRRLTPSPNFLYETIDIAIWSLLEPAIGIFAGSLPALRPLFRQWNFGIRTGSKQTGSKRTPNTPSWRSPASGNSRHTPRKDGAHPYDDDADGSETELNVTTNKSMGSSRSAWDIEQNIGSPVEPPPNRVFVETRVNISSHSIDMPRQPDPIATTGGRENLR